MRGVYAVGIGLLGRNLASRHLHSMEKLDRGRVKDLALHIFLFEGDILSLALAWRRSTRAATRHVTVGIFRNAPNI